MAPRRKLVVAIFLTLISSLPAAARIISYSPYTDRTAVPALQHRMNRYFVLLEAPAGGFSGFSSPFDSAQVVLYDSTGADEPRVIYPTNGRFMYITAAAVRESNGVSTILIQATEGSGNTATHPFYLSTDSGHSWRQVAGLPNVSVPQIQSTGLDTGGPYARGRNPYVRVGNANTPFVVAMQESVYAIDTHAQAREIYRVPQALPPAAAERVLLAGSDREGERFLVKTNSEIRMISADGINVRLASTTAATTVEGWITPAGDAYVQTFSDAHRLWLLRGGVNTTLVEAPSSHPLNLFAVPTFDYSGAWIIERGAGRSTALSLHTLSAGLVRQWEDVTAPEVEALHAGASGRKLLVQVHRPRPMSDQSIFIDPALAIWTVGEGAPRVYDELFMNEQWGKGFVHLDVEAAERGEPFVFDSGILWQRTDIIISPAPPASGGGDVLQEWGVVRASLKQKLIIPSVGRTAGAFGSFWSTDVILQNPLESEQRVEMRFVPESGSSQASATRTITLAPRELRLMSDILGSTFGLQSGLGALHLQPESAITATSRTYTTSAQGAFGFGMNALDWYAAAASPRFAVTFAGAFLGPNYRTNLVVNDVMGKGTEASVTAAGPFGGMGLSNVSFSVPAGGQQMINNLTQHVGVSSVERGALLVRPAKGAAIASVFVIDNRTNDSTYFPPDLPAPFVRTIPVIGHLDGANNSRFRSDLYLYNPAAQPRTVLLQAQSWDGAQGPQQISLTLLGNEARVIPDALQTIFGRTGLARLRYQSMTSDGLGVRVTSRTYNVDENGGTYGFLMPPLNNFQAGTSGDTLEILGAVAGGNARTNIGLVELTNAGGPPRTVPVRVEIVGSRGQSIDQFTVSLPVAGGMQINDVFRTRNLNVSGPVLIRISPQQGAVGAYATVTDNGTNDSIYLAANLAARQ